MNNKDSENDKEKDPGDQNKGKKRNGLSWDVLIILALFSLALFGVGMCMSQAGYDPPI